MVVAGLLTSLIAGIAAFATTLFVLRNAERLGLVAVPNERSSHTRPTPSGGGVGIVAGGTIGGLFAVWFEPWPALLIVVLALAMAGIGFIDDRRPLPPLLRLAAQLILAAGMVATVPLEQLGAAIGLPMPELLLAAVLVLATVYWVNIFNFMDGIDGLAGAEAAFMLLAAIVLALADATVLDSPTLWWFLAIAVAAVGFLLLNLPPARIFMGDAGSTYLGFMLAFAAWYSIATGWLSLPQWLILGALFVSDATLTLLRRGLRGEPVFRAHRLHAYQHLSRRLKGHAPVTLIYTAINVFWLLPLGWAAGHIPQYALAIAIIAYVPLIVALTIAGAGAPEKAA